jgi:hypothetical protein
MRRASSGDGGWKRVIGLSSILLFSPVAVVRLIVGSDRVARLTWGEGGRRVASWGFGCRDEDLGDEKKLAMRLEGFVAADFEDWRDGFSLSASTEGEEEFATKGLMVRIGMARGSVLLHD